MQRPPGRGPTAVLSMRGRGAPRSILRSGVDIKRWRASPPSVEALRPSRCPACGAAGRPAGRPRGLHGHGSRERQFRGPASPGAPPEIVVLRVRRYRCQPCGVVVTVAPREAATGRLYTITAVAWALALFGVSRLPEREVRRCTSPWRVVGACATRRWVSLRRWITAVVGRRLFIRLRRPPGGCDARKAAAQIAIAVSAHASPTVASLPLPACAFLGAVHAA